MWEVRADRNHLVPEGVIEQLQLSTRLLRGREVRRVFKLLFVMRSPLCLSCVLFSAAEFIFNCFIWFDS